MSKHKKSFIAVAVCALVLGASALLPADLSPIGASYAADGDNGGGNGGGKVNGKPGDSSGQGAGPSSDHTGTATRKRDHGVSGKQTGTTRTDRASKGQGSGTANSRGTRGVTKSSAVSPAKPGTHKTKEQTNTTRPSTQNDR